MGPSIHPLVEAAGDGLSVGDSHGQSNLELASFFGWSFPLLVAGPRFGGASSLSSDEVKAKRARPLAPLGLGAIPPRARLGSLKPESA